MLPEAAASHAGDGSRQNGAAAASAGAAGAQNSGDGGGGPTLQQRVEQLTTSAPVILFMKAGCSTTMVFSPPALHFRLARPSCFPWSTHQVKSSCLTVGLSSGWATAMKSEARGILLLGPSLHRDRGSHLHTCATHRI